MRKQNHWWIQPGHPDRYLAGGFFYFILGFSAIFERNQNKRSVFSFSGSKFSRAGIRKCSRKF